jgi:V8-like Glu-specific endopeptidase
MRPSIRRINGRFLRPAVIFGSDNRLQFKDSSYPWRCIGKIFASDGFVGSGALVAHNIVVTAGHMVPATAWGGGSWWMRFVPAYYDGASLLGSGVQSYVSNAKGWAVSGSPTGYDWAILKLYNPIGDSLGWFGYNGYSSDWEDDPYWTVVGYPGDVAGGQRPSWQSGISVFDDDSDSHGGLELEHRGDINPGNSGGPMFAWWSGDPRLIGVVSGWEEDYIFPFSFELGNVTAGGSGFTSLIAWGRSNW